jgi:3-oxoacyl-(acyl-carrier-protein) synthase
MNEQVAVCAGLEALKNAGVVTGEGGVNGWVLPESMQATTGVVYATSFPALDAAIQEVSRYYDTKMAFSTQSQVIDTMNKLRSRLESTGGPFSENMEKAFKDLHDEAVDAGSTAKPYEFDRKFLFRVLVLGNAQLAQIIKARGPNMQTNAACAGCTQAVALAYDMIQVGRAERVVVIAGDNASSDVLMPWLGNGFRALGAATIAPKVELACLPFQKARSGMILGSGGIGMMLESEAGARRRFEKEVAAGTGIPRAMPFLCRLLGTLVSNSAYHGAAMDRVHIAAEMERFISSIENELNIPRQEIARNGVYFSHETSTHASPTSSCAANELYGLRKVFGENMKDLLILNTKGFTGHPMGVSFEDVVACEVLTTGTVPPIANFVETDPALGDDLKLSRGGAYPCKYALRFAAGFGSHVALALYGSVDHNNSPATTSRLLHP